MNELGQIYTAGLWTVRPGREADFIAAWEKFAKWTTEHQPGAISGLLLQDMGKESRFISFGPWRDTESIDAWRNTPEFAAFLSSARELCEDIQPSTLKSVASAAKRTISQTER